MIDNIVDNHDILKFTLSGLNVSLANAIRRTILSDIPTIIFRTTPYEENKATIYENTSRLNNEIVKQRLGCIPIHYLHDMKDTNGDNIDIQNYIMELNVVNDTDTIVYATTEDFKVKNIKTDKYLSKEITQKIFPPNEQTGYFIDFVRLRPKISEEIHGEKIHLTSEFSIGNSKENGMYSVVSTCSYGNTPDEKGMEEELARQKQTWKNEGKDVEFESKNWKLLDGLRIFKKDSFDFIIQTIGVFTNYEIVNKACSILMDKLTQMNHIIDSDELKIIPSESTMSNSYDVILENEDYTIGKIIEYFLYLKYFEREKTLTFCGFKKQHPHDSDSIIRLAYKENISDKTMIKQHLKSCIVDSISVYKKVQNYFI